MKLVKIVSLAVASAAFFIACESSFAQWQVPQNTVPLGTGSGTGFSFAPAGTNNQAFMGSTGSAPAFRALIGADVPQIALGSSGNGGVGGVLPLANGGLGGSQSAATANQIPVFPGSNGAAAPTSISSWLDGTLCSATSSQIVRSSSAWGCPTVTTFVVSQFASVAAAVTALNAAGSGVLFFDTSQTVSSALAITVPVEIRCASKNVTIGTSSATVDLFTLSGNASTVRGCNLAYTGGSTKTAGSLLNITSTFATVDDTNFNGNCFVCITSNGIDHRITNSTMNANTIAVAGSSCGIVTTSQVLHLANNTIGSGPSHPYNCALRLIAGAVDLVNQEYLQETQPIQIVPGAAQSAFLFGATSYLDNCAQICLLIQPSANTGTVGYVNLSNMEIGTAASNAASIELDTGTNGGNIGNFTITGSQIFSYNANTAAAILLNGSLGVVNLNNNPNIGTLFSTGINTFGTSTASLQIIGNNISPSSTAISFGAAQTNPVISLNRFNGKTMGITGTYVVNNVP